MSHHENGLDVLSCPESLSLLTAHTVGRVGLCIDALPVVLPVNYVLDREQIVLRTGEGSKLSAALRNAVVCFQVDEIDATTRTGWSVIVTGTARELVGDEAAAARSLPIDPWAGADGHIIAIQAQLVSGRRITV